MKKQMTVLMTASLAIMGSCKETTSPDAALREQAIDSTFYAADRVYSRPIPLDTANKMIKSYLTSIHPDLNPFELKSLIFDANLLRAYLNDSSQGRIQNLKMVLAHRLPYINSGHFGQRPDSNSEALTLVLVGYGQNGNYIYYNSNQVLNICQPCPRECPEQGSAANDLLPVQ